MADPMAELEAEMKKEKEARAAQARLQAAQQGLFDLSAPNTRQPERQTEPQQRPPAAASSSSAAPRTGAPPTSNAAVYIPKSWATAGQEPDLAVQRAAPPGDLTLIENESVSMPMCGCGGPGGGPATQFFAGVGLHPPSDASFEAFFRGWFEREHFPTMCEDLKRELVHRAKSKGFFSGLSSQVKKWAMANTDERLQSEVWCTYFLQNNPPKFRVLGPIKMASINLGSQAAPCHIPFMGWPETTEQRLSAGGTGVEGAKWKLPPFCGGSADISALLDELDGRGGMAALLSGSLSAAADDLARME